MTAKPAVTLFKRSNNPNPRKGANSMKYSNFYMRSVSTQQLYNFVLTPFQCQFLKEVLSHCDVLEYTAGRKWQMIQLSVAIKLKGFQMPKNSLVIFDRNGYIWAYTRLSSFIGKKKNLKYMRLACYDPDLDEWSDTIIGRNSLSLSVYDAIVLTGRKRTKRAYDPSRENYAKWMNHARKAKKGTGGQRDFPETTTEQLNYRGFTDESYWAGMVGSMVANGIR